MKTRTYFTMNAYWFGLAFLWNGLHPIILPAILLGLVPETQKNSYLGILTFVGLVLAMVIQPLAGSLSDRYGSSWGQRRPWMLAGTVFALVCLSGMAASSQSLLGIIITYLLLQLAMNTAQGPAQGLIPDLVPTERRGFASGIKNLFDMGGLVVTSLVAGQLMGSGNPVLAIAIIGTILAASTAITLIGTPEGSARIRPRDNVTSPLSFLRLNPKKYPNYARLLVSRFLILLGIYTVQGFAQYFIRDRLGIPNAAEVTGNLMAAIGVALTLLVFPAGWLSDRFGRKNLNILGGGLASLGILLIVFVNSITMLYLVGAVIGMATGIFLSVNWALAIDLIPTDEAGKFMGLSNLATAGAGASARLAGPLIDLANNLLPGEYWGYPLVFALAALVALAGTLLLRRIKTPQ
ncbi:MAG: MFS transporter [Anaerolineales bacterium]|nr:MFS transporter [Anaerolineales bacterium]